MKVYRNVIRLEQDPENTSRAALHIESNGQELSLVGDPEPTDAAGERAMKAGEIIRELMVVLQYIPPAN